MSILQTMAISAAGLDVQRQRIDISSQNVANASSTRTPGGGPYQRKSVVIEAVPVSFEEQLGSVMTPKSMAARVAQIVESKDPPEMRYDPSHPDANPQGYVAMPNVNGTQEMVDILAASKAYEANVTAFNMAKGMALRTFEIGSA